MLLPGSTELMIVMELVAASVFDVVSNSAYVKSSLTGCPRLYAFVSAQLVQGHARHALHSPAASTAWLMPICWLATLCGWSELSLAAAQGQPCRRGQHGLPLWLPVAGVRLIQGFAYGAIAADLA